MLREGGVRIRTWDSAIDDPPYLDTLIQLDGDTLLRVHPQALKRSDLIQRHRKAVARSLAALMSIRRWVRRFAIGGGVLVGGGVTAVALTQHLAQAPVSVAGSSAAVAAALYCGSVLGLNWTWLFRVIVHLLIRLGTGWFKAQLASVSTINRVLEWICRLLGRKNRRKMAVPMQFQALLEAVIDPDEEREKQALVGQTSTG
ncbi:MAG: hypothetical protein U9Q81_16160 [Pseudomonadota bacterium]|nr:hypothetical protein [Pseudomonadota bacterium]